MSQFPADEADELATREFHRAETAALRTEMVERIHQQTMWLGGAIAVATAVLSTLISLG